MSTSQPLLTSSRDFDPALLPRLLLSVLALLLLWPAIQLSEFNPAAIFSGESLEVAGHFLAGFWPLRLDREFLTLVLRATLETLALATAGIALALVVAIPLSLIVTQSLSRGALGLSKNAYLGLLLRFPCRLLLIVLRSIPDLVWALLFVRLFGLGPAAGVLAIAIHYSGMLGKVFFETYESCDPAPQQSILAAGGSRMNAFLYGVLPQCSLELLSYSVYRWECAIRASVVMGFVGAGGLGQQMELSLKMLAGNEVATMLLVFIVLVVIADGLSALVRRLLV